MSGGQEHGGQAAAIGLLHQTPFSRCLFDSSGLQGISMLLGMRSGHGRGNIHLVLVKLTRVYLTNEGPRAPYTAVSADLTGIAQDEAQMHQDQPYQGHLPFQLLAADHLAHFKRMHLDKVSARLRKCTLSTLCGCTVAYKCSRRRASSAWTKPKAKGAKGVVFEAHSWLVQDLRQRGGCIAFKPRVQ